MELFIKSRKSNFVAAVV